MLYEDHTASQTFELYGPKNYSMAEIAELVDREIYKKRRHINVPKAILQPVSGLLNRVLWWPISSADEVEREFIDQQIDENAKTFKDLGIEPGDISKFTYHYLVSLQSGNSSALLNISADARHSKGSAARLTMIFPRQQKRRGGRRSSTCMCSTISRKSHHRVYIIDVSVCPRVFLDSKRRRPILFGSPVS